MPDDHQIPAGRGTPAAHVAPAAQTVAAFREVFLLPLALDGSRLVPTEGQSWEAAVFAAVDSEADRLAASDDWQEEHDLLLHLADDETRHRLDIDTYNEFVLFFPVIHRFLFRRHTAASAAVYRPIRLFRSARVTAIDLDLTAAAGRRRFRVRLAVARRSLYLIDLGLAVLALEVATDTATPVQPLDAAGGPDGPPRALTIADAEVLLARFRWTFPPALEPTPDGGASPSQYPDAVRLHRDDGSIEEPAWGPDELLRRVRIFRHAPLDPVWSALFAPLATAEKMAPGTGSGGPGRGPAGAGAGPVWRQVVDENIVFLSYIATADPDRIAAPDLYRLCRAEEPPARDASISPSALAELQADGMILTGEALALVQSHGLTMIGPDRPPFTDRAVAHFRRQIFQMVLVGQIQRAALIMSSDSLSRAVKDFMHGGTQGRFHREVHGIQKMLVYFTQRYWFSGMTNRPEPAALYTRWRRQAGLDSLYDLVRQEARDVNQFLDTEAERQTSESAVRLNIIATVGLVMALVTGFMGMNVVVEPLTDWASLRAWGILILTAGGFTFGGGLLTGYLWRVDQPDRRPPTEELGRFGRGLVAAGAVLCLLGVAMVLLRPHVLGF